MTDATWEKKNTVVNCQTQNYYREENFSFTVTMGKLGNFDLNEQQRKLELQKYERRMALRAQFWKDMTNPNRHGSGEGGFMVCI